MATLHMTISSLSHHKLVRGKSLISSSWSSDWLDFFAHFVPEIWLLGVYTYKYLVSSIPQHSSPASSLMLPKPWVRGDDKDVSFRLEYSQPLVFISFTSMVLHINWCPCRTWSLWLNSFSLESTDGQVLMLEQFLCVAGPMVQVLDGECFHQRTNDAEPSSIRACDGPRWGLTYTVT